MTKADKDRIYNKADSSSQSYLDDDADFLDDLMDDVMGMDESGEDSQETESGVASEDEVLEEEVAPESGDDDSIMESGNEGLGVSGSEVDSEDTGESSELINEPSNQADEAAPSRIRRKGGLLNKFNVKAKENDKSTESGDGEKEQELESGDRDTDRGVGMSAKKAESGKRKRAPLFSVVRPEISDGKDTEEAGDNKEDSLPIDVSDDKDSNDVWDEANKSSSPIDDSFSSRDSLEIVGAEEIDPADDENIEENIVEDLPLEDDLFDDMLEDLTESDDLDKLEKLKKKAELDPEVVVPLEKPGMDEVVVTPDGRTLAEMLPGLRGGNRPVKSVVDKIKNQEEVVELGGKKFSDDRYTKHAPVIDKEVELREKRIALSMKFLQRNADFTEQEKVIMKNLGVTSGQLSQIMRSKELTYKEKNELLSLGRYGAEKHFKGRRYRTTVGDTAMLEFLVKFKYANTRILRWISNEPQNRTWRKLNRLRNSGLVESKSLIGVPDLWGATPAGTAITGYALNPGLRPMPKIPTISSGMGVNYIAACLWFNTVNVLNLEDFPAENRVIALQDDGRDRVRGEMLVSELEIRSSLGKEINPSSTTMQSLGDERLYDVISENVRVSFEEWEDGGKVGDSPEALLGNEYMWVLFPTSQLTLSYHVPDLVVKRERGPNGEPRSIAVEMERYEKTNDRYDKIMLAYKLDEHLYEKVIWITPNTRVARALEQAAESVDFDRYSIIPIITEDGVYDKQDIWMI